MDDVEMSVIGEEVEVPGLDLGSLASIPAVAYTQNEINESRSCREKSGIISRSKKQVEGEKLAENLEGTEKRGYEDGGEGSGEGERWKSIQDSTTNDYLETSDSYRNSSDSDEWGSSGCSRSRNQVEKVVGEGKDSDRIGGGCRSRRKSNSFDDEDNRSSSSNSGGNESRYRNTGRKYSKRKHSSRKGSSSSRRERRYDRKGEWNGGYMSTDSEDDFDLIRTLRHYRPGRRQQSVCDSSCSCPSCASESGMSFFSSEEGPPGGEATRYRRAAIWLESVKYMMNMFVYGLIGVFGVFTLIGVWVYFQTRGRASDEDATRILYWAVPMLVVMVLMVIVWQGVWWWLIKHGYAKGDQILDRHQVIRQAQMYNLVYTIRGAVYGPTEPNPRGERHPARYNVVAYESEHDPDTYFDSDLEEDGQYRRSITPWREVTEPQKRERRNIYTRKAWFRDVPIVWWELQTKHLTDM